jgi:hypothetical protein
MIVIEHWIDHGRALRLGIGDEIAHGIGRLVEKGPDRWFSCHGLFLLFGSTSVSIDIYISYT